MSNDIIVAIIECLTDDGFSVYSYMYTVIPKWTITSGVYAILSLMYRHTVQKACKTNVFSKC